MHHENKEMRIYYFILLLFIIGSCINNTKSKEQSQNFTKEELFWKWFESKSNEYFEFESNQSILFNELEKQLKILHPNLTFVFSGIENNKREFIISADGIKDAFPKVESLVEAAPKMDKWDIIAFRPRLGTESSITYEGLTVKPEDIMFKYGTDTTKNKIGLEIFIRNYNEVDDRYLYAAFLLLDNALGEYDVEMKIGYIEFNVLPKRYDDLNLVQFNELPKIVDDYYKK